MQCWGAQRKGCWPSVGTNPVPALEDIHQQLPGCTSQGGSSRYREQLVSGLVSSR